MPTIRIDEEVFAALQQRAQAFVDTPNHVLRRLFNLDGAGSNADAALPRRAPVRRGRASKLKKTAESEFRRPILEALDELGGRGSVGDVLSRVKSKMVNRFFDDDLGTLASTGELRWENNAKWARKHMIDEGLLSDASSHGIWEITGRGRQYLAASKG